MQPDASIISNPIHKKYVDFAPALVIEILSEATVLKDRITKFGIYEKFGIRYYLMVDPEKKSAEIYMLENSRYKLQEFSEPDLFILSLTDDCTIDVVVKNLWE